MKATIDHIVLNVRDVDRALDFYTRVIGLTEERGREYRAGKVLFPSVRIDADSLIDLMPPALWGGAERGDAPPNMDHFCLSIDAESWSPLRERLAKAGVEIELGPTPLWGAHGNAIAVYIRDPEGNRIELRCYE